MVKKIFLPINGDISDSNTVAWGPNNINPIQAAMFKLARTAIAGNNIAPKRTATGNKNEYHIYYA